MAADGITLKLEGVDELKRALAGAAKQIRTKAVRAALRDAGRVIQKAARMNAPVLKTPTKHRKPGTVKQAISVRASKFDRRAGNDGVFISVRPLRGSRQKKLGKAGATNPNDPYFWWWQELGWVPRGPKKKKSGRHTNPRVPGKKFMTNAAREKGQEAVKIFMSRVIPQIQKLNDKAKR